MTEDPQRLNDRRISMGIPPVEDGPPEITPTPQSLAEYEKWLQGYEDWLRSVGWRQN
jgi:hypothetical protein